MRAHLLGRKRTEVRSALLFAAGHVRKQHEPAADHLADARRDLGVGPAGGDHLVEDPDVAGPQVRVQEVARPVPADPQRIGRVVHLGLALQQPRVLGGEHGEHELALRAEVVVDLAEGYPREVGDPPRRQCGIPVGQDRRSGRVQDPAARVGRRALSPFGAGPGAAAVSSTLS